MFIDHHDVHCRAGERERETTIIYSENDSIITLHDLVLEPDSETLSDATVTVQFQNLSGTLLESAIPLTADASNPGTYQGSIPASLDLPIGEYLLKIVAVSTDGVTYTAYRNARLVRRCI